MHGSHKFKTKFKDENHIVCHHQHFVCAKCFDFVEGCTMDEISRTWPNSLGRHLKKFPHFTSKDTWCNYFN